MPLGDAPKNNEECNAPGTPHSRPPVVFIYSGYRTSSTWFWSCLRKHRDLHCYYEVFNEILSHLRPNLLSTVKPSAWRSGHPDDAPYYAEFAALLEPGGGVPGFPAQDELGSRLLGKKGLFGPLDEDVRSYLSKLVDTAHNHGKIPVITCTRMLGRAAGIQSSFPGLHILLVRNLFRQWNSYSGQHRTGNTYFLFDLYQTRLSASANKYISYLLSFFDDEDISSFDRWISYENYDKIFCFFISLNIYLLIATRRQCDLTIQVSDLARSDYRASVERELRGNLNLPIDLSGAADRIDHPRYGINSIEECKIMISGMVEHGLDELGASSEERDFSNRLLDDTWEEQRRFSYYTMSVRETMRAGEKMIGDLQSTLSSTEQRLVESEAAIETLNLRLAESECHDLEQARDIAEKLQRWENMEAEFRNQIAAHIAGTAAVKSQLDHEAALSAQLRDERDRLYENLTLEGGPMALRSVLPLARLMRPLIRYHGALKRSWNFARSGKPRTPRP